MFTRGQPLNSSSLKQLDTTGRTSNIGFLEALIIFGMDFCLNNYRFLSLYFWAPIPRRFYFS